MCHSAQAERHLVRLISRLSDYAKKIYDLVISWTGGQHTDEEKCIRVAVIADSGSSYIFFCHPNFDHPKATKFYESTEDAYREKGVIPELEATMMFLGRKCEVGAGSRYKWFLERYQSGTPVLLEFSVADTDGSLSDAEGTRPIVVFDVLFADRADLQDSDPLGALLDRGV